jgi:hypothetical protein
VLGVVGGEERRFTRRLGAYLADFGETPDGEIGAIYEKRFRDLVSTANAALAGPPREVEHPRRRTAK